MYLSPLSPVLQEVLNFTDESKVPYLHTTEASTLKKFFLEKVAQSLLAKKKTLIVIPDSMSSTIPAKLLTAHKLAHYSLHLSKRTPITVPQMERLKMLSRIQEIYTPASSYKSLVNQKNETALRIETSLNSIHHPSEKGPSLKDMILDEVDRPADYVSHDLKRALSAISLDHETLALVYRMQQCYQKHYAFLDHNCYLNETAFLDHDHIAQAQDKISVLHDSILDITKSFNDEIEKKRREIALHIEQEVIEWTKIKEEVQLALYDHTNAENTSSFDEVYNKLIKDNQQFNYLKFTYHRQQSLNWGEAQLIIDSIQNLISNTKAILESAIETYLKRLTPFNMNGSIIEDNFVRGTSLLRSIQNISFLKIEIPKRFFQVSELLLHLKEAFKKVDLAQAAMMDAGYCHYREMSIRSGLTDEIRRALTSIKSTNWRDTIKYFANQVQLNTCYNQNISRLPEDYQELQKISSKLSNICIPKIHNGWCKIRDSSFTTLKNDHWKIYQSIWVDNNYQNDTITLLDSLRDILLSFCPLYTVHESELNDIFENEVFIFDQVIFLESKGIAEKALKAIPIPKDQILILSSYNIQFSSTDKLVKSYLSTDMTFPTEPLSSYSNSSEKYRQAVAIAGALIDLVDTTSIFKWKDQIVLSFVDEKVNDHLLHHLNIQPHHFLYRSTLEIGHIVEALLSDKPKVLIGENHLLNDRLTNCVLWQTNLIKKLKAIQLEYLSIDTATLFKNKHEAWDALERKLQKRITPTVIPISSGQQLVAAL